MSLLGNRVLASMLFAIGTTGLTLLLLELGGTWLIVASLVVAWLVVTALCARAIHRG